jgi:uncharacterized iron-regulated protein
MRPDASNALDSNPRRKGRVLDRPHALVNNCNSRFIFKGGLNLKSLTGFLRYQETRPLIGGTQSGVKEIPACYAYRAMRLGHFGYLLVLTLGFVSWVGATAQDRASFEAVDLVSVLPPDKLVAQLATKRVVFIGEIHDRHDHHVNQLEIIRRLHEREPNLAIGVEYFQQAFQQQVDDYIAGRISENEFLRTTEYYLRWKYDYRLYAPIFRYARDQHIPVRALNVPTALTSAVAKVGIAGLSGKQSAYLPREIEPADEGYKNRLRNAFEAHQSLGPDTLNHFVEAQLVWDEGMAESAAAYLTANPGRLLVVLAGAGHVAFGSGIPKRLQRRTNATYAIVLNSGEEIEPHMADYLLLSGKQELPPAGVLDVNVEEKRGECRIASLNPGGAGEKAGLKRGDVLVAIDTQIVKTIADMHLALWDKQPGDRVRVEVRRTRPLRAVTHPNFEVELEAAPQTPRKPI